MSESNKKDDIAETTEKLENVTLNTTSSTVTSSDNKKETEPKKESTDNSNPAITAKEETKENAPTDNQNQAKNDNQPQQQQAVNAANDDKAETKAQAQSQKQPQQQQQQQPQQQQQQAQQAQASTVSQQGQSAVVNQAKVTDQSSVKKTVQNEDPNSIDGDNTNLIINYLPPTMSEGTLATLFSPYGLLERCKIVVDLQTLRSRGYGFVKYDNEISAERALNALNGYELNGKKLKVAFARKQCKAITNANLYITNVPPHFTDSNLRKLFQDYGKIVECRVLMDQNGQSRGVGFVRMDTHHNAIQALQAMDQYVIDDKHPPLLVKLAQRRVPRRYWNSQNRNQNQGGNKKYGNNMNNNQGGMGGNMGGNGQNKNKKRNSPNRKYYSPKNNNNNYRQGGMGMDNNMGNSLGGNNNNMGGGNRGSPSKRGYYRAKNNQGQSFNKGSNQQRISNQNYNNNNNRNRGGGAGPNQGQAPYFPAPMHDAYGAPPYGAPSMPANAYGAAYATNIPMNANLSASGVGGQNIPYQNK